MPTPYRITCLGCGDDLEVKDRIMDGDGDIIVDVKKCETCCKSAYADGLEDGRKEASDK